MKRKQTDASNGVMKRAKRKDGHDDKASSKAKTLCLLHPYHRIDHVEEFQAALLHWRGDPPPYTTATVTRQASAHETTKGRITQWLKQEQSPCAKTATAGASTTEAAEGHDTSHEQFRVTAYGIWVSEVMLQQTQVAVVIPYWIRWMRLWPTLRKLAEASEDDVRAAWAGLGYYRRALRLLETAQQIVKAWIQRHHVKLKDNKDAMASSSPPCFTDVVAILGPPVSESWDVPFPRGSVEELRQLPGIGDYTSGAILSIAFGQCVPAVDGNVIRVMSRLAGLAAPANSPKLLRAVHQLTAEAVCPVYPGHFNQALMDIGASICVPKKPVCDVCPLRKFCRARREVDDAALQHNTPVGCHSDKHQQLNPRRLHDEEQCDICVPMTHSASSCDAYPLAPSTAGKNKPTLQCVATVFWRQRNPPSDTVGALFDVWLQRRPPEGLLGGERGPPVSPVNDNQRYDEENNQTSTYLGSIRHVFSHITHEVKIVAVECTGAVAPCCESSRDGEWVPLNLNQSRLSMFRQWNLTSKYMTKIMDVFLESVKSPVSRMSSVRKTNMSQSDSRENQRPCHSVLC